MAKLKVIIVDLVTKQSEACLKRDPSRQQFCLFVSIKHGIFNSIIASLQQQLYAIQQELNNNTITQFQFKVDIYLKENFDLQLTNEIVGHLINYLAKKERFISLFSLKFTPIFSANLKNIEQSQWKFITSLSFINCSIGTEGALILSAMELRYLKELDISYNLIKNQGIGYICKAKWPNLKNCYLRRLGETQDGYKYLLKRFNSVDFTHLCLDIKGSLSSNLFKHLCLLRCKTISVFSLWNINTQLIHLNQIVKDKQFGNNVQKLAAIWNLYLLLASQNNEDLKYEIEDILDLRAALFFAKFILS